MAHKKFSILTMIVLIAFIVACGVPNLTSTPMPATIRPVQGTSMPAALTATTPPPVPTNTSTPPVLKPLTGTLAPDVPVIKIARHPQPADMSFVNPSPALPKAYDPNSQNPFQNDYRSANLTPLDLSKSLEGLLFSDFDSRTRWPAAGKMPPGFDPQAVMELGKDPGLGVRQLHSLGITGRGIGIAIIDQTLLVDHQEYAARLKWYEETNGQTSEAQMHGPAVASISVGKTVGVAPEADLYYLADNKMSNYTHLAESIHQVVELNTTLPEGHKIRVLSMSIGWMANSSGVEAVTAAVNEAKAAGIFVVNVGLSGYENENMVFMGLGRGALQDPNDFQVYTPSPWWGQNFYSNYPGSGMPKTLLVPMDARTTASPTGNGDYAFYAVGGMSWAVPYLAGMYVLACQVKPDITPEEFWSTALATGRTIQITHEGKNYSLGIILDPPALMAALEE